MQRVRKAGAWLMERPLSPPRIVTMALWLTVAVTPIGVFVGFRRDASADLRSAEITRCEQRIESRQGSRARALTNIEYVSSVLQVIDDFVGIPEPLRVELDDLEDEERRLVDEQLPVLTLQDCLDPPPATTPRPTTTTEEP